MSLGLGQRIAFSLGALLVYHVGTYIPIPGIDSSLWLTLFRGHGSSPLSMFYANDAVHRLSILALGIFPYLSAAVVVQLLSLLLLRTRAESSPRRTGDRYVLALTATFAALQASGIAFGLERVPGLVSEPGWLFRTSTIVSLIGGSFFLIWLSGLITARGVGNGLALLLFAGIATDIPAATISSGRRWADRSSDKTFFFGAYEGQRERVTSDFSLLVPTQTQITEAQQLIVGDGGTPSQALTNMLAFFPASATGTTPGSVEDKNDVDSFIAKIDHQISATGVAHRAVRLRPQPAGFPARRPGLWRGFAAAAVCPDFAHSGAVGFRQPAFHRQLRQDQ